MIYSKRDFNSLMENDDRSEMNGEILISKMIINDNSIIIDAGARDSFLPSINKNATYHLFEPIKYNFNILIEKFKNYDNVKLSDLGLSDINETVEIFKESESICRRIDMNYIWEMVNLERVSDGITEKINCITLNDYLKNQNILKIDLLKIDVEGYEYKIIKGLGEKLKIVNNIIFEYGLTYKSNDVELKDVLNLLVDFDLYLIQEDGLIYLDFSKKEIYDIISGLTYCNILAKNKNNG